METTTSFAPLAGRLAAKAAEIRPADGAEVSWANFMALFFCAILYGLIALCEALDARAAADARLLAAPAARDADVRAVLAVRSAPSAMPRAGRLPRLARAPDASSIPSVQDAGLAGTAEPQPEGKPPAWPAPHWRPPRIAVFPEKRGPTSWRSARLFCYDIVMKNLVA